MNAGEATDLFQEAKRLHAQGQTTQALGILETLEKAFPGDPRLAKAKARCLTDLEKMQAAPVVPTLQIPSVYDLDVPASRIPKPVPQPPSKRWLLYAGAAALALVVVAGSTVWAARYQPSKAPSVAAPRAPVAAPQPHEVTSAPIAPILPDITIARPSDAHDSKAAGYPVVLDRGSFNSFAGQGVVLVDFWAAWCPPCRKMSPIIDQIAAEYAGRVRVGKVNTDQQEELARAYNITGIPTFMIFRNGEVVYRESGGFPKQTLTRALDGALRGK